jgi:hypothetical protein
MFTSPWLFGLGINMPSVGPGIAEGHAPLTAGLDCTTVCTIDPTFRLNQAHHPSTKAHPAKAGTAKSRVLAHPLLCSSAVHCF